MTSFCLEKNTKAFLKAILLLIGLMLSHTVQAKFSYDIKDLGTLGGFFSQGNSINASGQVTGIAGIASDGWLGHGFVTSTSGVMSDFETLHNEYLAPGDSRNDSGGSSLGGRGINSSGQITGNFIASDGYSRAFVTDRGGHLMNLGTLGGYYSFGNAINDSGLVTGSSDVLTTEGYSRERAFVTNGSGQLLDLGTLGDGYFSRGNDINVAGQVTGLSSVNYNGTFGSDTIYHAFITNSSGTMIDLGSLGGSSSGNAINDFGQVTGSAETDSIYRINHAFVTSSGGQMIDLDSLSEKYSSVGRDINNTGQVIGQYQEKVVVYDYGRGGEIIGQHIVGGETRNFVTIDGVMVDIDSLLDDSASGWSLHGTPGIDYSEVTSINDLGQITGFGNHNGFQHAFILTPHIAIVPIPAAFWMMGWGLFGLLSVNQCPRAKNNTQVSQSSIYS